MLGGWDRWMLCEVTLLADGIITLFHHIGELNDAAFLGRKLPVMHAPTRAMLFEHQTPRFRVIPASSVLRAISCFSLSQFVQFISFDCFCLIRDDCCC